MLKNQHLIRLYAQHRKNHRKVLISVEKYDDIKNVKYQIKQAYNAYVNALKLTPVPIQNYDVQLYMQGFLLFDHYISYDVLQQEGYVHFDIKYKSVESVVNKCITDRIQEQQVLQIETQHSVISKNQVSQNTMIQYLKEQQLNKDLDSQRVINLQQIKKNNNQTIQNLIQQKNQILQQKIQQQYQIFYQEKIDKSAQRLLRIVQFIDNYLIYIQRFRNKSGEYFLRITEDLYINYSIQIQIRDFAQILEIQPKIYNYDKNSVNFFIYCLKNPINLAKRHKKFKRKLIDQLKINPNLLLNHIINPFHKQIQKHQNKIQPPKLANQSKHKIELNPFDVINHDKNIRQSFKQKIYDKVKQNQLKLQQQLKRINNRDKKKQDYQILLQSCQMISIYKQSKMEKKWLIKQLQSRTNYAQKQILQFFQYTLKNSNYFTQNHNNERTFYKANHSLYVQYLQFLRN